ncbi:hypothetical protein QD460_33775, partial [Rhizobium jaguaris]
PQLAKMALEKGYGETSHVVWMKTGWPERLGAHTDHSLGRLDVRHEELGRLPRAERQARDEGAICRRCHPCRAVYLNRPPGMDLDMQIELFEQAMAELDDDDDLANRVLEISLGDEDELRVLRYALPKG